MHCLRLALCCWTCPECLVIIIIIIKVDSLKAVMVDVAPNDEIGDVVRKSVGYGTQDVTCEERVLRKVDELKSCGVRDGTTVQIVRRTRGGGKHKVKKKQAARTKGLEKKYAEEPKSDKGSAIRECDKDAAIQVMEENEEYRRLVEDLSEGSETEMEQKMQCSRDWTRDN